MRIIFCGRTFPASRLLLEERLPDDEVCVWPDRNVFPPTSGDVLIPMMFCIDAAVMDAIRPRLIQQWGSGLEGVDLEAARERGIPVASVPASGSNADSVAEHALLLMLALFRQLPQAQANLQAGVLGAPLGRMLAGSTVCLWGLGATALSLAHRLHGWDVKLIGITRDPGAPKVTAFGLDACYSSDQRAAALGQTEIPVMSVRLHTATRNLVDSKALAALPAGACLVNAARGALVDYHALYSALSTGHLAGAALDVFWEEPIPPGDPLLALPNVIATPHIAGVTNRSYADIADAVAENIERLGHGAPLLNRAEIA